VAADHPDLLALEAFAQGRSTPADTVRIGLHVAGCDHCRARVANLDGKPPDPERPAKRSEYAAAFRRGMATARKTARGLEAEERSAAKLFEHLLLLPPAEQSRALRANPRVRTYGFARHLLTRARSAWIDQPYLSEDLARLAAQVADHLPSRDYGRRPLHDLRAEAWAYIGNALRIQSNLTGVPEAFARARDHLRQGTLDQRERAEVTVLQSTYFRDQGRLAAAGDTLEEAIALMRRSGPPEELARFLISQAILRHQLGHTGDAMRTLIESIALADLSEDRRLPLIARHNLAYLLSELGEPARALPVLQDVGIMVERRGGQNDRARLRWTAGRILHKLGRLPEARAELERARASFQAARIPADVGLLGLDLAELNLDMGNTRNARDLAAEAFPIFAIRGIEHLTLTALELFQKAGGIE